MKKYRYFLEPIGHGADEALAELLNQLGESAQTCERRNVIVDGKVVEFMYEVPRHSIMTITGHSIHKHNFRAYFQINNGETHRYSLYGNIGKKLVRTKEVKQVARALEEQSE